MGCRPSRHSLGKVGDSTWEYNRAYMQDMDKKKFKNKKSGRGRGRRPPSYNDFSSTSKTYVNDRECKSSKITVRLSTDGSMLEIETFDVDLNERDEGDERAQSSSNDIATASVHAMDLEKKRRLQRCESAPELINKTGACTEPVVWKSWTKVPNTETVDVEDKFTCVDKDIMLTGDFSETRLCDINGQQFTEYVQVVHDCGPVRNRHEEHIPTPEADQICDMFLKKAIITQDMNGYESMVKMPESVHIHREPLSGNCTCKSPDQSDQIYQCFSANGCKCKQNRILEQNVTESTTCSHCHCKATDRTYSNPVRPSSCEALSCLVLYGKSKIEIPTQLCCLCLNSSAGEDVQGSNIGLCDHQVVSHNRDISARPRDLLYTKLTPVEDELTHIAQNRHSCSGHLLHCETSKEKRKAGDIDRTVEKHQDDPVKCTDEYKCVSCSCTNKTKNGFHKLPIQHLPSDSSAQTDNNTIGFDISNAHANPRTCNFDGHVSMTTNDKIIKRSEDERVFLGTAMERESAVHELGCSEGSSKTQPWTVDDLGDLYYDGCGELFSDDYNVVAHYNFDFLDISEDELEEDETESDGEYESSETQDVDNEQVELQDPFDNIPTVTRAFEGYSAIYDDDGTNSVDGDDDSDEIYIDAVESSYV